MTPDLPPLLCSPPLTFFFLNDPATPETYTLSLHNPLPNSPRSSSATKSHSERPSSSSGAWPSRAARRSEEHTSELQSPCNLVCRLLLEKKNRYRLASQSCLNRARLQHTHATSWPLCLYTYL